MTLSRNKTPDKADNDPAILDFANSQYLKESVITATSNVAGDGIKAIDEDENPKTVVGAFLSEAPRLQSAMITSHPQ